MIRMITLDFSQFGIREIEKAEQLLRAWRVQGLPEGYYEEEITVNFNTFSGEVFLMNCDGQIAKMDGDKLEIFYFDFETGEEGFFDELSDESKKRLFNNN